MSVFLILNFIIGAVFTAFYAYQLYYIKVALTRPKVTFPPAAPKHSAILICARDEESVIGILLDSIWAQTYPKELIDVYVCADNCTDGTAELCRSKGATVFERANKEQVGKGFALHYLLDCISENGAKWDYDNYFILDADNVLDAGYVAAMNDALSDGNQIVTCYRNSKNYGDNWLSASYALWFLRETIYLNNAREILGLSSHCSGTGFAVRKEIFEKHGGWNWFTLTEDVEFTFAMVSSGVRIAFCAAAVLYDEQPTAFSQSWKQRMRWIKGYFQSYAIYGRALLTGAFRRRLFPCYDMLVSIFVGSMITLATFFYYFFEIAWFATHGWPMTDVMLYFGEFVLACYAGLLIIGIITTYSEWDHIYAAKKKKLLYLVSFPLFLLTLLPIVICAPFSKAKWPHIKHGRTLDAGEILRQGEGNRCAP